MVNVPDRGSPSATPPPRSQADDGLGRSRAALDASLSVGVYDIVVLFGGEVDVATFHRMQEWLDMAAATAAGRRVVVDLAGVSFMDSQGVRVLATGGRRLRADG